MTPFPNTNVSFSPPPLQTPIIRADQNQFGVAWQNRTAANEAAPTLGDITAPWLAWFNQVYVYRQVISGTRSNRLTLNPSTTPGQIYFETDTGLYYAAVACVAAITGATNATPIVYSTDFNAFINGDVVNVSNILGNLTANRSVTVGSVSTSGFTGTGTAGSGAYVSGGVAVGPVRWTYMGGTYRTVQANIATFTAGLTVADCNLLVDVTDYAHVLRWTGAALTWNDPADMPGRISSFLQDPNPTTGWQLCDGTGTTSILKYDGTLVTVTVPNIVGVGGSDAYVKLGTPASATINPAVSPTFTPSGGTISSVSAGTPAGTVSAITATGTGGVNVTSSGATSVAAEAHTHSAPTFTGSALATHTHTLTGLSGSIGSNGEPSNIVLRPWLRL